MRATRRAPALKGASPARWGFPRPPESPVFVAMWNPLSLLLTVLCSSLLGETVCLGRQGRPCSFIHLLPFRFQDHHICLHKLSFFSSSIWGGILLAGGLYCVLWGKNKEETRAAIVSGQQEHSRELDNVEARGREHHVFVNFLWFL